jgi:hypothetical protein
MPTPIATAMTWRAEASPPRWYGALALVVAAGCGRAQHVTVDGLPAQLDGASAIPDATACATVAGVAPIVVGRAGVADDYALTLTAYSAAATSWGQVGNEAVVLEVSGAQRGFIGHLVLHQGQTPFAYTMHLGALAAGEGVQVIVSSLTAVGALSAASLCGAQLVPVSTMGAGAAGIVHAPIFRWPVQKAFNDLPMVVGWSSAGSSYETVMTNEDGGTAMQCGGGAAGMQAEIARWGRSTDIELHYAYAPTPTWERCTGRIDIAVTPVRLEGAHPILYWGDGHNRLFESRAGYGQACGTGAPEMPDGDFAGWNVSNPDNSLAGDDGHVIVVRPLPVDLDALGFAQFSGRREALADRYAPWLYHVSSLELAREGKIDDSKTFAMSRYLYVDVRVADVGGTGDSYCSLTVSGGFKLRAVTADGTVISSPQITKAYAGNGSHTWKRVAIALPPGIAAADIDHFQFDSYDKDGIYLTALGDAFIPIADQTLNGATLDYVRHGEMPLQYYVDDDRSACTGGVNMAGPGGLAYTCTGSFVSIPK